MHLSFKILEALLCFIIVQPSANSIDQQSIRSFEENLLKIVKEYTYVKDITSSYDDKIKELGATTSRINGFNLIGALASGIEEILTQNIKSLEFAVEEAERIAENYTINPELTEVHYLNARKLDPDKEGFVYHPEYMEKIGDNVSAVQIPVEIYEGRNDVLNDLKWTSAIEKTWISNRKKYNQTLFQYFGSYTGLMRIYPATKWSTPEPDLYDARRQPWYTQGASSPKDMLILIDTSGSTHGQALTLIKETAKAILNTLGQNDYVAVVKFAEATQFIGCFKNFVQANPRNKEVLLNDIDKLQADEIAMYKQAFKFAFERIREFNKSLEQGDLNGAKCNKVIMFLTDGGTDTAEDIFKMYNWPEKKVRVFTYMVGPQPNAYAAVKWIACANRGHYSRIPAMGDIRATVQIYLEHLAHSAKEFVWTTSYHKKLGIMSTVTLPVFNTTADPPKNTSLLGVMGTDVPINFLKRLIPKEKLGINGYSFAINNNGYVLFHPDLISQRGLLGYTPILDLLEIQIESTDLIELRKRMIQKLTGTHEMEVTGPVRIIGDGHIYNATRLYYYTFIPKTTYSVAIVLPSYRKHFIKPFEKSIRNKRYSDGKNSLDEDVMIISPWEWCKNVTDVDKLKDTDISGPDCDKNLIDHLFLDILATEDLLSIWREKNSKEFVSSFFYTSESGLTRFFPLSSRDSYQDDADVRKSSFFKRSLDSNDWFFSTDNPTDCFNGSCTSNIVVGKSFSTFSGKMKASVTGFKMTANKLRKIIIDNVASCTNTDFCLLIDDGGYLIASSNEDDERYIGSFIGSIETREIYAKVMNLLVKQNVYKQIKVFDYQAKCPQVRKKTSGVSRTIQLPFIYELLTFSWWNLKMSALFTYINLFFVSSEPADSASLDETAEQKSCLKAETLYMLEHIQNVQAVLRECSECDIGNVEGYKIKETNLFFVSYNDFNRQCDISCPFDLLPHKSTLSDDPDYAKLECVPDQRFRRRPDYCFQIKETQVCGTTFTYPNLWMILILIVFKFKLL
ncbi:DgyrCDS4704 [Dimorphilus gyrociliatus]|uniref:DgyrCDS4704 n=1 Tax=Dimorphilus gyrociliatus TaxID=2664684 RepID=A0A7I8VHE3_9ANNE|nr:DgyrCDS4704 [Dimorphilus gyrociliatus]